MNRRNFLQLTGIATATALTGGDLSLAQTARTEASPVEKNSPFLHPGIIQTRTQLNAMKRMIQQHQGPVSTAWNRLMGLRTSSLNFEPKPATHVLRSANGRDRSGADEFTESGQAAHSHALQWYVGGDAKHAEKSIEIIDAWSRTLWDFSGNDAKLLAGWTGGYFCEAAEILRATYPAWSKEAQTRFRRMLTRVMIPLLAPFFPEANGNWDGAIMFTVLSIAVYLDDLHLFNRAVSHFQFGHTNAGILKYVWPNGQCEESGRDQGHVQLGLGYFSYAALVAWNQHVDLFGAANSRLALGFEYTSKYMLGNDVPHFGIISPRLRGNFSDFYEAAYQHYRFDKKIEMPYTAQAAERARSDNKTITAVWLFRGELETTERGRTLQPDQEGAAAGATDDQDLDVESSWDRVDPGQSVQAAIDRIGSAGTIVLSAGIHELNTPLRLRSNLTLIGCGRKTILHLTPTGGEYALVNASPRLEKLTLRNFIVEGSASTEWPADPNQTRRGLSLQMATPRGGILLNGDVESDIREVVLDRITVRNCVGDGISISGATALTIKNCDVSDSGGNNAPGNGLNHNLALNHVSDCTVHDCRLVSSLGGCGLSVQNSTRVVVTGCELSRNWAFGAQFLNSTDVNLKNCLLEANNAASYRSKTDGLSSPISVSNLKCWLNGSDSPETRRT